MRDLRSNQVPGVGALLCSGPCYVNVCPVRMGRTTQLQHLQQELPQLGPMMATSADLRGVHVAQTQPVTPRPPPPPPPPRTLICVVTPAALHHHTEAVHTPPADEISHATRASISLHNGLSLAPDPPLWSDSRYECTGHSSRSVLQTLRFLQHIVTDSLNASTQPKARCSLRALPQGRIAPVRLITAPQRQNWVNSTTPREGGGSPGPDSTRGDPNHIHMPKPTCALGAFVSLYIPATAHIWQQHVRAAVDHGHMSQRPCSVDEPQCSSSRQDASQHDTGNRQYAVHNSRSAEPARLTETGMCPCASAC